MPSGIAERRKLKGGSYSRLAIENALAKAKDVAKKVKSGIIIGADTIVVQNGKI